MVATRSAASSSSGRRGSPRSGAPSHPAAVPITSDSETHNFRPVIPRDWTDTTRLVVFSLHGGADGFRNFRTVIRMDLR